MNKDITLPEPPAGSRWEYRGTGWKSERATFCYQAHNGTISLHENRRTYGAEGHYWEAVPIESKTPRVDAALIDAGNVLVNLAKEMGQEVVRLNGELEIERIRLAAVGVVAMADTPESAKKARDMHPDYRSASLSDVERRVDECIRLRSVVSDTADLIYDIMRDEVNVIDECEKWFRAYAPEKLREAYETKPAAPVCPPELLPLPDGAVYLGTGLPKSKFEVRWSCPSGYKEWRDFETHGPQWQKGWSMTNEGIHYATLAGDACHRAQPWFDESQVPSAEIDLSITYRTQDGRKVSNLRKDGSYISGDVDGFGACTWDKIGRFNSSLSSSGLDLVADEPEASYPPPESEWPEKPAPPEGCVWVRDENLSGEGEALVLVKAPEGKVRWSHSGSGWTNCNVVFRAEPIDHTEGGEYRMLEEGETIQSGDEYLHSGKDWLACLGSVNSKVRTGGVGGFRRPVNPEPDHTEGGKYWMLEEGERICTGDEMHFSGLTWDMCPHQAVGCSVHPSSKVRRPVAAIPLKWVRSEPEYLGELPDHAAEAKDILQEKLNPAFGNGTFRDTRLDAFVDHVIRAAQTRP